NCGNRTPPVIGPDGVCHLTIANDESINSLLSGCNAVCYDLAANRFIKDYGYHNLGGCNLVGDETHALSIAGTVWFGLHTWGTAGGKDVVTRANHTLLDYGNPSDLAYGDVSGLTATDLRGE